MYPENIFFVIKSHGQRTSLGPEIASAFTIPSKASCLVWISDLRSHRED